MRQGFSRFSFVKRSVRSWTWAAALSVAALLCLQTARPAHAQDQPFPTEATVPQDTAQPDTAQPDTAQPNTAAAPSDIFLPYASVPGAPAPLCRMGVNVTHWTPVDAVPAALRIGWYIDYHARADASHPNDMAYTPVINLTQVGSDEYFSSPSGAALDAAIAANPGADWIIGNEPDRRYYQNDLEPRVYARAFHELARYIRTRDPSARLFAGAIVQPTPLRLQYLNLVLAEYRALYGSLLPADGWAIHNFILNERSCSYYNDPYICWGADIPPGIDATDGLIIDLDELQKTADINFFKEQIVRFRQWMADNGYRSLPLYVSEYGVLMPEDRGFPPALVNQYMNNTFDYMLTATSDTLGDPLDNNRLVQRFAWYSTLDLSFNGSLLESTTDDPLSAPFQLSVMGQNFASYTSGMQAQGDFDLLSLAQLPVEVTSGNSVSVTLRATLVNAGDNQWPLTTTVQFYLGDPAAGGVLIGSADRSLTGCGTRGSVDFVWADAPPSAFGQSVYARLSAGGASVSTPLLQINNRLFIPQAQRTN